MAEIIRENDPDYRPDTCPECGDDEPDTAFFDYESNGIKRTCTKCRLVWWENYKFMGIEVWREGA